MEHTNEITITQANRFSAARALLKGRAWLVEAATYDEFMAHFQGILDEVGLTMEEWRSHNR